MIEYIEWNPTVGDKLDQGRSAAAAQGAITLMTVLNSHYAKYWRCIRILAEIEKPCVGDNSRINEEFHEGDVMFDIEDANYTQLIRDIQWTWRADDFDTSQ